MEYPQSKKIISLLLTKKDENGHQCITPPMNINKEILEQEDILSQIKERLSEKESKEAEKELEEIAKIVMKHDYNSNIENLLTLITNSTYLKISQ